VLTPARLSGAPRPREGLNADIHLLTNWTDRGVKNAKASPKRQEDARKLAKKFNVEWKTLFMTMGAYDFVLTVEAPDDAALAKYVVSLCALGNVRTTTLKAFTEAEHRAILAAVS
jgi:uncharacterized protein with GYD domain